MHIYFDTHKILIYFAIIKMKILRINIHILKRENNKNEKN